MLGGFDRRARSVFAINRIDLVSSRLVLAPIFRRRLVEVPLRLGHPYWVDDPTFDIQHHIRRSALPSPGGIEELAQFVGDVCSRQLDRTKPLWEMYIVEGLAGGRIAVVTKIHHCTIDGVSGAGERGAHEVSVPLVLGTPFSVGSIATASRSARAKALKAASIM